MTLPLPAYDGDPATLQFILDQIAMALPSTSLVPAPRIIGGGQFNDATALSTTSTTYTTLSNPDQVSCPVAANGLIIVGYQAIWQNTVANNAKAAIFCGANQLKNLPPGGGAPVVQEITGSGTINVDAGLFTSLVGLNRDGGAVPTTEVTTGQVLGSGNGGNVGAFTLIFGIPATASMAFSIQFKNTAAGTLTVKNRHLYVLSLAFS